MYNPISGLQTLSQLPCVRRAQGFITRHPYACAVAAIGTIAGAMTYWNTVSRARTIAVEAPISLAPQTKAEQLIAFYHALPATFNKPEIPSGQTILMQATWIKAWMEGQGNDAISHCETLNLSDKNLTALPPEIGLFRSLKTLYLLDNQLQTLPVEIRQLTALQTLNLSDNELQTLPAEIQRLTTLRTLNLSNNQLQTLPTEIEQLTALQRLFLSGNQLQTLPAEIGQLTAIQKLFLSGNQLRTLPTEIRLLTALQELHLSGNQLQTLPAEIGQLRALRELHLSGNLLQYLPAEIGQLTALQELNLIDNQLQIIPDSIFDLSSACTIEVEDNLLTQQFITGFQQRLISHRNQHLGQGPHVNFSIHEAPNIEYPQTLEANLEAWAQQFENAFPNNEANAEDWLGRTADFSPILSLEPHITAYINEFLTKVADFSGLTGLQDIPEAFQHNAILRVERMIQLACKDSVFKTKMTDILQYGGSSCGDRAKILFNDIEIEWQFHHKELTEAEFIDLAKRAALYDLLTAYGQKYAADNGLGDEIETILHFQLRLRKLLNLPISTENMLYQGASGLHENSEEPDCFDEAYEHMLGYRDDTLLTHSKHWKERLKLQHQSKADAINEKFGDILEQAEEYYNLEDAEKAVWLNKQKGTEIHAIVTKNKDYTAACAAISKAREDALKQLGDNDQKDPD